MLGTRGTVHARSTWNYIADRPFPLSRVRQSKRESAMLLTIAAVLLVLWLLGFAVFPVAGGLIHIVLVVAIIVVIVHFLRGRTV